MPGHVDIRRRIGGWLVRFEFGDNFLLRRLEKVIPRPPAFGVMIEIVHTKCLVFSCLTSCESRDIAQNFAPGDWVVPRQHANLDPDQQNNPTNPRFSGA